MAKPRNEHRFDPATNEIIITTAFGEEVRRRAWLSAEALEEFKYAVRIWMSCMDPATRAEAVDYADQQMLELPFFPVAKNGD